MARKSRRQTPPTDRADYESKLKTAVYARLSVEKETTESLETQISMLHQYISEHARYELVDTYADNGCTGTDFDRPEFTRMLDDARNGRINCIIVKDLSRFGRNLVETGYYLEALLPRLKVRLVAVNDDFDSSRDGDINSIVVPVKNLINEMYAKDFSRKAVSSYELHSLRGDAKILKSTFGYLLDKQNNILVPNPQTAPIVQVIFRWHLLGHTPSMISKRLNILDVITPEGYKCKFEMKKPIPSCDGWTPERVKGILTNETYVGSTVHGKRRKALYKGAARAYMPKEEWIIHKNTHLPLVSQHDFDTVQRRLAENRQKYNKSSAAQSERPLSCDYFPQKVFCMDCGTKMTYRRYTHGRYGKQPDGAYYVCGASKSKKGCGKRIHEEYLRLVVSEQIRRLIVGFSKSDRPFWEKQLVKYADSARRSASLKANHLSFKLSEIDEGAQKLYQNYADGLLDFSEYHAACERYQVQKRRLDMSLEKAKNAQESLAQNIALSLRADKDPTDFLKSYGKQSEFIDSFIEKVYVSGAERMEICFKCEDIFDSAPTFERIQTK